MIGYMIRDNKVGLYLLPSLNRWGDREAALIIWDNHDAAVQALNAARDMDYYRREHADAIQLVILEEKTNERRLRTFRPIPTGLPRRPTGHA